jgi:hypothetical protein
MVAARGYTPQRISNFAVEHALSGFARATSLADFEVLVYEDGGHLYANFSSAQNRSTWTCDLSMGMAWHERGVWDAANGRYDVWGPRVHTFAFGVHLVGNRGSNTIAKMDTTIGTESDGRAIRRLRIGPPLWASSRQRLEVSRFELKAESGLGLPIGQGSDPMVMLRTSRNAKTWGSERMASAGKMGDYDRRIVWTRCGSSDSMWVPEVTVSDPTPWRLSGAEIDGSGFQQARAAA